MSTENIKFLIQGITTDQFAIIDTSYREGIALGLAIQMGYSVNIENHIIVVTVKVVFDQEKLPIIILDLSCHFSISDENWAPLYNSIESKVQIPNNFAIHLGMLTVGTLRGVLHAKTENTIFNQFILPPIDITQIINKEDVVINLESFPITLAEHKSS